MIETDRIFFNPGDLCQVKHNIDNVPVMWVVEKMTRSMASKDGDRENMFLGIKCRWFDVNGVLREAVFSTKDLQKVE